MEMILKWMGAALGIAVPVLFSLALRQGLVLSPLDRGKKLKLRGIIVGSIAVWTISVWILALNDVFSYHTGDSFPRFLIPLFTPVLAGLAFLWNNNFRTLIAHTPLSVLAGTQTFRLAGAAFILIVRLGILPPEFASGGYGDILTGVLALLSAILLSKKRMSGYWVFLAFSAAGMLDLLNVAFLLLRYYPIWYGATPNSAAAADFSLVMIPAMAAPVALLLHIYALINYWMMRNQLQNVRPV